MSHWWPSTRRRSVLLGSIIALGLGLRLALWWHTPIHQPANDEVEYLTVARDLVAGRGWVFYETYHWLRAPLYPLWLAFSLWLAGGDLRWAALPNIALSTFTIYLFYLLGREVGDQGSGIRGWGSGLKETRNGAPEKQGNKRTGEQASIHQLPVISQHRAERAGLLSAGASAILLTFATFASLWMAETLFNALFVAALFALLRYGARPRLVLAGAAGGVLGLAILTRSLPLTALPFAALWVLLQHREPGTASRIVVTRTGLLCAWCFVLCSLLTIAPWTIRNYRAYGGFIAVETGLSFNLWMFNEPREDVDTIFATLESIPNPVERSDYATQKGLERLREDPAILLRKLWPNWNYLWRVKPIQDRFLQPNYYQDIGIGRFMLALALDDALYVAIGVLGLTGLIYAPLDRRKAVLGGWTLYAIAVILVTHGEARYRHFFFPALIPYAAWLLVTLRASPARLRQARLWSAGLIAVALLWHPVVTNYPRAWAAQNLGRGWAVWRAEQAARRGDHDAAVRLYRVASRHDPRSGDARIALARLFLDRDREAEAIATLEEGFGHLPSYARLNVWRGEAYRRAGWLAEAREAFKGFYNYEQQLLDEAWAELDPPLPRAIDVGDGLDFGLVSGVYAAETQDARTVRWSGERAELRLAGTTHGASVRVTLSAPRPDGSAVPVTICANDSCERVALDAGWRTVVIAAPPGDETRVTLETTTFRPRDADPTSPDDRALGVLIDGVEVRPFDAP